MQNLTANTDLQTLDNAINTMDRQGQFEFLLPHLPGYLQTELTARWQEAGEVTDPQRREHLQGAILCSMYGVSTEAR